MAPSLGWLWIVERQRLTITDAAGAAIAIAGALVIIGFAPNAR
jgi:drug/metabolite transporter superfamily protein YnfA